MMRQAIAAENNETVLSKMSIKIDYSSLGGGLTWNHDHSQVVLK